MKDLIIKLPTGTPPLRYKQKQSRNLPLATHKYSTDFRHLALQQLLAQHLFHHAVNRIFRSNGTKETIDSMLAGPTKQTWTKILSNEWSRLAQGNMHGVSSTNTIEFIYQHEVPQGRDVTYATYVLDYGPLKSEPYRVRITVGGNRLTYKEDTGSPEANLLETKVLINSIISNANQGAKLMTVDIKDCFLATPMAKAEYMRVQYKYIPEEIKLKYNLKSMVTHNNYIYIRIKKGMYGLKQAAILAYDNLKTILKPFGYVPVTRTVGFWKHGTRPTTFCLYVDDFGIKYYTKTTPNTFWIQ